MRILCTIILGIYTLSAVAQVDTTSIFTKKSNRLLGLESSAMIASYSGLYFLWYKGYDQSSFHLFNDSKEWGQMDKMGHTYSSYWISDMNAQLFKWSGMTDKNAIVTGTGISWLYMSGIELFDGFSSEWGASPTDLVANTVGCLLFGSQEYFLDQQIIRMKYSYSESGYAEYRPEALGSNWTEQLLKDYNGQTYWLSANIKTITSIDIVPEWLNIAMGYSINGYTGGHTNPTTGHFMPNSERKRQYLLSLDIDLSKIKTKNTVLKTILYTANCIKIPAPAIELKSKKLHSHLLYF